LESYSEKVVDAHKISEEQNKIILVMSFYDLEELVKIHPNSGSCYISSSSEPFNEEMEMDFERLISWLQHYGLPRYHVHVSGHIMPLDLKEILMNVKAKTVFSHFRLVFLDFSKIRILSSLKLGTFKCLSLDKEFRR